MSDLLRYETEGREAVDAANGSLFIHWRDSEVGRTVAPILGGENNNPLHRANLDTALELLDEHVETGDVEDGVVSKSGYPWVSHLQVRVFNDDGTVTQAWIDTVDRVLDPLEDYPVLDEERYSEYEREELEEAVRLELGSEALADVILERTEACHPDDLDLEAEVEVYGRELFASDGFRDLSYSLQCDVTKELVRVARLRRRDAEWTSHPVFSARRRAAALVDEALADRFEYDEVVPA